MSETTLETIHITDDHTTDFGGGYINDMTTAKEAIRRIGEFEYRKIELLSQQNDLMNKLAECTDKISEIDYEIRAIDLELIEKVERRRHTRSANCGVFI
ncbi:MAG: hypothetical protein PHU23_01280 [Dehalococcoidales bacterium]|nr:hypothetical protein [Dehalococcoidales bacterium]